MNKVKKYKHNNNMKTKYKINKNELILDITFLYEVKKNLKKLKNIYEFLNFFLEKEKIKFKGNRIKIFIDGIFIGEFNLTNFYLNKLNFKSNSFINETNSYFIPSMLIEISPNKYYKTKKIINA